MVDSKGGPIERSGRGPEPIENVEFRVSSREMKTKWVSSYGCRGHGPLARIFEQPRVPRAKLVGEYLTFLELT